MGRHKRQQKCDFACSLPVAKDLFTFLCAVNEGSPTGFSQPLPVFESLFQTPRVLSVSSQPSFQWGMKLNSRRFWSCPLCDVSLLLLLFSGVWQMTRTSAGGSTCVCWPWEEIISSKSLFVVKITLKACFLQFSLVMPNNRKLSGSGLSCFFFFCSFSPFFSFMVLRLALA